MSLAAGAPVHAQQILTWRRSNGQVACGFQPSSLIQVHRRCTPWRWSTEHRKCADTDSPAALAALAALPLPAPATQRIRIHLSFLLFMQDGSSCAVQGRCPPAKDSCSGTVSCHRAPFLVDSGSLGAAGAGPRFWRANAADSRAASPSSSASMAVALAGSGSCTGHNDNTAIAFIGAAQPIHLSIVEGTQ